MGRKLHVNQGLSKSLPLGFPHVPVLVHVGACACADVQYLGAGSKGGATAAFQAERNLLLLIRENGNRISRKFIPH